MRLTIAHLVHCVDHTMQHVATERYPRLRELGWLERVHHLRRFMRTATTLALVSLDYKTLSFYEYGTSEYAQKRAKARRAHAVSLLC